jgi:hypothetical protein
VSLSFFFVYGNRGDFNRYSQKPIHVKEDMNTLHSLNEDSEYETLRLAHVENRDFKRLNKL